MIFQIHSMKKSLALLAAAMFTVACLSLYMMLETQTVKIHMSNDLGGIFHNSVNLIPIENNELNNIEVKIKQIEDDLQRNHKTISDIKAALKDVVRGDVASLSRLKQTFDQMATNEPTRFKMPVDGVQNPLFTKMMRIDNNRNNNTKSCLLTQTHSKPTVTMLDVYQDLKFEDVDGGVWKQGWELTADDKQWNPKKKLKVFVMPHSHNDPGWLKTFEEYFRLQTVHIFNHMVAKLGLEPDRKFIWAEVSYLSMWWAQANADQRSALRKLIENGQLEIVTGGWVMTDEANAHYFAMVDQLIEGHEWLKNYLGVKPKAGWAIDPFGHSPTMAYILKRAGFKNMLIQRVHYAVKKYLAQHKQLEFMWRQSWDPSSSTDMFCHMMPFYSYDVPHTCGPDPKICCQFDFKRLPGGKMNCPWKVPPQPITPVNVAMRSKMILDQWRKKSQIFRTNVVLAPLGDDFRYDKPNEWDQQFENYKRLFSYMNAEKEMHVEAQFGTLSDFFQAVAEEDGLQQGQVPKDFPSLAGDFFTYADRSDHYWSGYYTSKPFYKRLDRVVESHVRGAEILFSLANAAASRNRTHFPTWGACFKDLVFARRNLALFQHHDGITGTSREAVTADYGKKLKNSLAKLKTVMVSSAQYLISNSLGIDSPADLWFDVDEVRHNQDSLPQASVLRLPSSGTACKLILYNALAHARQTLVRLRVDTPWAEVRDGKGNVMVTQTNLVWTDKEETSTTEYELAFIASLLPLSLNSFSVRAIPASDPPPQNSFSEVTLYNAAKSGSTATKRGVFRLSRPANVETFSIENGFVRADFSGSTGLLKSVALTQMADDAGITLPEVTQVNVNLEFVKYGTTHKKEKSGAYLFLPDGPATPVRVETPLLRVVKGRILTEVHVFLPNVFHVIRLRNVPGVDGMALEINNLVDIRPERNFELAMRLNTDLQNEDLEFFTDLNGFQVIKRRFFEKLPLQANFYPMPTMAFIEDKKIRVSVLSGQSLGVASLARGWLEIVLDRRLAQDDNRGLAQGLADNKLTPDVFRLLVEKRPSSSSSSSLVPPSPSLVAHHTSLETIHPVYAFPQKPEDQLLKSSHSTLDRAEDQAQRPLINVTSSHFKAISFLTPDSLPCDVHLLNLRTTPAPPTSDSDFESLPSEKVVLLLHRLATSCLECSALSDGRVNVTRLFADFSVTNVMPATLTAMHARDGGAANADGAASVDPSEIGAFLLDLK